LKVEYMVPGRADWPKYVALSGGLMVSVFAAAVLAAWAVHFVPLIQILPGQPPLTRQGALNELLLGAALAFLAAGRKRAAAVCATIVLLVTALVGFEYVFGWNFGIDQLLGSDYVTRGGSPPGRISPVAALCYLGADVAILAMSFRKPARFASTIGGILASTLISVALVAFLAYTLGYASAYGWGHFRRISIQAAAVVVLLSSGIMALALEESRARKTLPPWLPLGIGLGLAVGALGIWQALMFHEPGQLRMLSHFILAGGVLGALLVAIAVYLAQKATMRSRELQEGKAAFERLFEASPDALLVIGRDGRIVGANKRTAGLFGYPRDEFLGQAIECLIPEGIRDLNHIHRQDYYSQPDMRPMGQGLDLNGQRKDGSQFPVDVSLSPLRSGGELQVLAAVRDITERRHAEEALRESEERFRNVFERSPLGLALVYPDYRIMKVSESTRRMLGYSEGELVGLSPFDLTHPEDREESKVLAQRLFKGEIPSYKIEKRYIKKSGEIMWATLTATVLRDREGRLLYSLGMIEDITERKQAQEALRESEERFRGVFETSPLGLALIHSDYRLAKVNPSLCRMSGYSEAELTSMNPLDMTHPDDREESRVLAERLFKGEIPYYQLEKRYVKKSGEIIWATMTATILRDPQGRPLFGLGMIEDITERKQEQESLRQSEERFRGVFEQGPLGITLIGTDSRLLRVNAALCRMLGYSAAELTGKTPLEFTDPDDRQSTVTAVEDVFKTEGPTQKLEKRYVKKSGEIIWGSVTASVIHDQQGKPLYGMGMIEDITERKRAEEELRTLSQRLSQAIRFAAMSVWEWDPRTNCFIWDDSAFEIAGIPKVVPLPYEQWARQVLPEDLLNAQAALQKLVREKTQETVEFRIIRPDGELRHVYAAGGPILDRQGNVARVVGIAVDITERKRAEEELRTLMQRLSLATRSASMGVWEWGRRTDLAIWNERMFEIFGIPKKARVTRQDWAPLFHPEDLTKVEDFLETVIRNKTQHTSDFRLIRPDGSLRYVSIAGMAAVDDTGEVTAVVGIVLDITDRKQLEHDLEAAREQAITSARLSALGMMAGGVAHEINNPLSIIHAMASDLVELVEEQGSAPPQVVARNSQVIRETAERIAKIVRSLRQISREGAGDPFWPTPLAKIVAETLEICRAKFEANGVQLLLPETIPELNVPCREVQISQALLNLMQNALDAAIENDCERWVRLEVEPGAGSVAISVIDSGPGIPSELRSRIGEPFFTTKPVGKGTGLGLSLSKTIAEDHGGSLAYSEDHGHTRFSLVLPLARKAEAA
jgi:PAS domain S-box-containing protein